MLARGSSLEVFWDNGKAEVCITQAILDETNAEVLRQDVATILDRLAGLQVIFNLKNVQFLTSSSLGIFLTLLKRLRGVGGTLSLCNVSPEVYEVFSTTRLTDLLNVHRTPCTERTRTEV